MFKKIDEESSLSELDYIVLRPVFEKDSSVSLQDMLSVDMNLALKVHEYLDIREAIQDLHQKEMEKQEKLNKRH